MYADDVKIFRPLSRPNDLLQNDLDCLYAWCSLNCMNLNVGKCKFMSFCRETPLSTSYSINGAPLSRLVTFVDLDILFDPKLGFHPHMEDIVHKAMSILGCIRRWATDFRDVYVTRLLYTSLEYASIICCPSHTNYISKIESVQKRFLLFCLRHLGRDRSVRLPPYTQHLKLISLPTLVSRRKMLNGVFIHKLLTSDVSRPFLLSLLHFSIPTRSTRSKTALYIPFCRTNYILDSKFFKAIRDFNDLSSSLDFHKSLYLLKRDILSAIG